MMSEIEVSNSASDYLGTNSEESNESAFTYSESYNMNSNGFDSVDDTLNCGDDVGGDSEDDSGDGSGDDRGGI